VGRAGVLIFDITSQNAAYHVGCHLISTDWGSFVATLRASARTCVWPKYMATSTVRLVTGRCIDVDRSMVSEATTLTPDSLTYRGSFRSQATKFSRMDLWSSWIGQYLRVTGLSVASAWRLATKMSKRAMQTSRPDASRALLAAGSIPASKGSAASMP